MKKRILCILLCIAWLMGIFPNAVFAANDTVTANGTEVSVSGTNSVGTLLVKSLGGDGNDPDAYYSPYTTAFTPRWSLPSDARTSIKYYCTDSSLGWGNYNPYTMFNIGNCTWYAFGRAWEILGSYPSALVVSGDAFAWFSHNKELYDSGKGGFPYSTNPNAPRLGAVACWSKDGNTNSGGHVAVVEQISNNSNGTKTIVTSESGYGSYYFKTVSRNTGDKGLGWSSYTFLGYIYITDQEALTTAPTVSTLTTDGTSYAVDETVTFTCITNGNLNTIWIYCPNSDVLTYEDVGQTLKLAFGMSGHYRALVEAWNGYGSLCSDLIDFYVGNPTYARISTDKTYYAVDETVTFTVEADGIKNNLWIYCPSGDTLTYEDVGTAYHLGFGMSGHFQALVETWNGVGSLCSDRIDFYVGNQTVTVAFDPNGGSVSPTIKTVTIGSAYGTLPTPVCTYYNFDGWYTSALGGSKVNASTTVTATSNHTLYAHWTHVCANGHNYSYIVSTPPTTTATGTLTGTCSRCGVMTTATLPKLTITDYNYSIIQAATCTANVTGRYTWKTMTYGTFSFDVTIPKAEHSYSDAVTPPTCTEQGYTTHTCSRCNDSYVDSFVPVLGHAWDNGTVTKQPTETTKGVKTFTCTRCDATRTESIPATGDKPCDGGEGCPSGKFVDVNPKEWYHPYVDYAVEHGLFGGTSANTFEPETAMTRAMLVTVLWRYEGQPKGYENTFTDVNAKSGSWYIDAVAWAAANNIVGGVGNGKFDPEGKITREQMATILFRYAKWKGIDTNKRNDLSVFPDGSKVESWAKDAVQWTVAEKIINGSDGKLLPQGNATRAQVATILMRFVKSLSGFLNR